MHQVFLYANCNRSLAYTAVSNENWSNGKMCCLRQTSVKSQRSVFDRWKHLMYSQRYSSSTLKVVQMESQSVRLSRRSDHDSWLIFNVDDFINAKIFFYYYYYYYLHSLLWHCWLGIRKSIRPVKIECGYVSGARCRLFACGPTDSTAFSKPHHLLPHLNPHWFYLSGIGLPRLSWKRGS